MKQKLRESLLVCLIHDVVMLNPYSRRFQAFLEGPVGTRIRRRVETEVRRAHGRAQDMAEDVLRKVVHKITF